MRKTALIVIGSLSLLIGVILLMQIPVSEIRGTVIGAYSVEAGYTDLSKLRIDSIPFSRMNLKRLYAQCQNASCSSNLKIEDMIAIHNFHAGRIYYKYSLRVHDKNGNPVYGCEKVPASIDISRRRGKWWIVGFQEQP